MLQSAHHQAGHIGLAADLRRHAGVAIGDVASVVVEREHHLAAIVLERDGVALTH